MGLAAFAPKIADLCRRSAGGGPGPIGLDQLNALKDEDLLAEDSGGMKKVQLVKVRITICLSSCVVTLHLLMFFLFDACTHMFVIVHSFVYCRCAELSRR